MPTLIAPSLTGGLLGLFLIGGASAAPLIVGTYYEDNLSNTCSASFSCQSNFAQNPPGKTLLTTHVACTIKISVGELLTAYLGQANGRGELNRARLDPVLTTETTLGVYTAIGQTSFLYLERQIPLVLLKTSQAADVDVTCRITGRRPSPF